MNTAPEMEDSDVAEEEDRTAEETSGTTAKSDFIPELNLVLILFILSLSAEERIKQKTNEHTDSKGNPSVSGLQFRRNQLNDRYLGLIRRYKIAGGAGGGASPYSEGSALYALGLIYANHGEGIKQLLRDSLRSTNVRVVQHGACLVLVSLLWELLMKKSLMKSGVFYAQTVLLLIGTASEKAAEMLAYAH